MGAAAEVDRVPLGPGPGDCKLGAGPGWPTLQVVQSQEEAAGLSE